MFCLLRLVSVCRDSRVMVQILSSYSCSQFFFGWHSVWYLSSKSTPDLTCTVACSTQKANPSRAGRRTSPECTCLHVVVSPNPQFKRTGSDMRASSHRGQFCRVPGKISPSWDQSEAGLRARLYTLDGADCQRYTTPTFRPWRQIRLGLNRFSRAAPSLYR